MRLNMARALLQHTETGAHAATVLAERFHISRRQAYRYLQHARAATASLRVPEATTAFTVKLPITLAESIRGQARTSGCSISELVTLALNDSMDRRKDCGS